MINHEEIQKLTQEYGGDWGVNHARRLLHLVSVLGEGMEYDQEAVWLAAYLHDWGGYQPWITQGVDHQVRSAELAKQFLKERDCPAELKDLVLEIIECHHGGNPDRSIESKLFTDADALDLLGVCGMLRIFAMNYRNLQGGVQLARKFRDMSIAALSTDKAKAMAEERIKETDQLLAKFEEETFGIY